MRYAEPLREVVLLRRYKRFLADVELADGTTLTVHCPNTGSMRGCTPERARAWISDSGSSKRKYRWTWEQVETPEGHRIGINTARANPLVEEALAAGGLGWLSGDIEIRREVKAGDSRFDFLLRLDGEPCFVEVKSVTLMASPGLGRFPDAVSERARRHVEGLEALVREGTRAALVFCVQHTGVERVTPADDIDPQYGAALRSAAAAGVEVVAFGARLETQTLTLDRRLPVEL